MEGIIIETLYLDKDIEQKIDELVAVGECKIIEPGFYTIIDTSKKGQSTGFAGKPRGSRKGNLVHLAANICVIATDGNKLIHLDAEMFFKCKLWEYTWKLDKNGYAVGGYNIYMHRIIGSYIYGKEKIAGLEIDHLNGERNINTNSNLRLVTHIENQRNKNQKKYIRKNHVTDKYEYFGTQPIYDFQRFNIPFDAEYPAPTDGLDEMKKEADIYEKEFSKRLQLLLSNQDYKEYIDRVSKRKKLQSNN